MEMSLTKNVDLSDLLLAMQNEICAQREIIAYLVHEIAATSGIEGGTMVERLGTWAETIGENSAVAPDIAQRVKGFADAMRAGVEAAGSGGRRFTVVTGGKGDGE